MEREGNMAWRFLMLHASKLLRCLSLLLLAASTSMSSLAADYVLIVDCSSSMKSDAKLAGRMNRTRLDVVHEALESFLNEIPFESRVYLAAFNRVVTPLNEMVVRTEADRTALRNSASQMYQLVEKEESGSTYLWRALDHALDKGSDYARANPDRTVTLRVLTDGEDNDPSYRFYSAQANIDRLHKKYPTIMDSVTLVILGSLEFRLRDISVSRVPDFHPSFPPVIEMDPTFPRVNELVTFTVAANQAYDSFDWSVNQETKSKKRTLEVVFKEPGVQRVKLAVVASNGQRESGSVTVQVGAQLNPSLTYMPASPEPGDVVTFVGRAAPSATSPLWLLDGTLAGSGNELKQTFAAEGEHEICFQVQDANGRKEAQTNRIKVAEKPLRVVFSGPTEVASGADVVFKNLSAGKSAEWSWEYGASQPSPQKDLHYRFFNKGDAPVEIPVVLHAKSALGRTFTSEIHKIIVHPSPKPPKAAFQVAELRPKVGQTVTFLDDSKGLIEKRQWDFAGEGESSSTTPEHTFGTPGEKTVKLTVTGPGGAHTFVQKLMVRPRQIPVTISLLNPNDTAKVEFIDTIDFGQVNPVSLRQGTLILTDRDTVQVAFAEQPEAGSALKLELASTNDAFALQLRQDGKTVPLTLPAQFQGNALIQIGLNTNAPDGVHFAKLTFTPVGGDIMINETNRAVSLGVTATIGADGGPGPWIILFLVVLGIAGGVAWWIYSTGTMSAKSQVEITIGEPLQGSKAGIGARPPQRFKIANGQTILLGRTSDSPSAQVYDIQAPDWRVRREPRRVILVNRRDFKSTCELKRNKPTIKEIKGESGTVRLEFTVKVSPPSLATKSTDKTPKAKVGI